MMKGTFNNFILFAAITAFIISCETDISVDLPKPESKLVVEGYIETGQHPYVFLTRNSGYFDVVDSTTLVNMMVQDTTAIITVNDGTTTDTLHVAFIFMFPYLGYSCDNMVGVPGKQYRLDIQLENKHYYAYTSILQPVPIDSVWFTLLPDTDTLGSLNFSYTDPPEPGNYYTYHTKVENEQFTFLKPYYGSHIDDDLFDNGSYTTIQGITKGTTNNSFISGGEQTDEEFVNSVAFGINTNIFVRLSVIDIEHYQFWNSYYRHMITWGNPFTNPATVVTNIEGDPALGFWGGYGTNIVKVHITDSATIEMIR